MNAANEAIRELSRALDARTVAGAELTTFAIGGPLSCLVRPDDREALDRTLTEAARFGVVSRVIGAGSNLLIADEGIAEPVVSLGRDFRAVRAEGGGLFRVGGAVSLMTLSRDVSRDGWSGLEFAGGIPGSLGGGVRMNAGAHGGELGERIVEVSVMVPGKGIEVLGPGRLEFAYRAFTTLVKELPEGSVVIEAVLRLAPSHPDTTSRLRAEFLAERKKRQPLTVPSCGSVFRNPPGDRSAGALIEQAGLKGAVCGSVGISEMHANWIVNPRRQGKAVQVAELIRRCRRRVMESFEIALHPEVVVWGSSFLGSWADDTVVG